VATVNEIETWLRTQLDEEAAEASQGDDLSWHDECCAWVTVTWHGTNEPQRGGPCDCGVPGRRLAEIEAKRRLLDWLDRLDDGITDVNWWSAPSTNTARQLLALPYAGRPGYREEWRP